MADNDTQNKVGSDGATDTESIREILAANIMTYRLKLKLSRNALAKKLDVSEVTIGQYERGNRSPSLEILCKLADVFDIPVDVLVGHGHSNYNLVEGYRLEKAILFLAPLGFNTVFLPNGNVTVYDDAFWRQRYRSVEEDVIEYGGRLIKPVITFKDKSAFVGFVEGAIGVFLDRHERFYTYFYSLVEGLKEKGMIDLTDARNFLVETKHGNDAIPF